MRIFIEPNTQAVIGNKDLPRRVVSGPAYVWLIGQRLHSQMSTLPKWLTFTSQECPTTTQVPVTFQISCKWSRNLAGFTGHQLQTATHVSNVTLESLLQKHLVMVAAHFASSYPIEDLVVLPGLSKGQLIGIKRHQHHLTHYLLAEMSHRLGYVGQRIDALSVNVTLPSPLQSDITELWRLQKFQDHLANLTQLKLVQAIDQGQPVVSLVISSLLRPLRNNSPVTDSGKTVIPFKFRGFREKDFLNQSKTGK